MVSYKESCWCWFKSCTNINSEPTRHNQETGAKPHDLVADGDLPVVWLRCSHPASLTDLITLGNHGDLIGGSWSPCGLCCTKPTSARFQSVAAGYVTALASFGSKWEWSKMPPQQLLVLQLLHSTHLQWRNSFKCPYYSGFELSDLCLTSDIYKWVFYFWRRSPATATNSACPCCNKQHI